MSRKAAGLRAWVLQRVTAILLGLLTLVFATYFVAVPPATPEEWRAVVGTPLIGLLILMAALSLLLHAWVGIRDVLMDYVPIFALRFALLTAFGVGFVACGLWVLQIVVRAQVAG